MTTTKHVSQNENKSAKSAIVPSGSQVSGSENSTDNPATPQVTDEQRIADHLQALQQKIPALRRPGKLLVERKMNDAHAQPGERAGPDPDDGRLG